MSSSLCASRRFNSSVRRLASSLALLLPSLPRFDIFSSVLAISWSIAALVAYCFLMFSPSR
nr:MAG TPA: hypothetical protein [Caudoviricetes sp.]